MLRLSAAYSQIYDFWEMVIAGLFNMEWFELEKVATIFRRRC